MIRYWNALVGSFGDLTGNTVFHTSHKILKTKVVEVGFIVGIVVEIFFVVGIVVETRECR